MTDELLKSKLEQYDGWYRAGMVPHSAKVIPVRRALAAKQWVLPTQQIKEILRNARSFALRDCVCRTYYRRCSKPLHVCLSINDMADRFCEAGEAERISLDDVDRVLQVADEHGLVHLSVYNPEQFIWGLCSCCSCCCYQLQVLRRYGRRDLVVHSDYIAVVDRELCTDCGLCAERCQFGARLKQGGGVVYLPENCWGCGLCVTSCPQGAVRLERRPWPGGRSVEG